MIVNGRNYKLWGQIIERKDEWIGGRLVEFDGDWSGDFVETVITDIRLVPNGSDSAWFEVVGENFSCGFDARSGGVDCGSGSIKHPDNCLPFYGMGGLRFRIFRKEG